MSVSWNGSGKQFAGAYSDGTIGIFNIKNEGKPEKIIPPHSKHCIMIHVYMYMYLYYMYDLLFLRGRISIL